MKRSSDTCCQEGSSSAITYGWNVRVCSHYLISWSSKLSATVGMKNNVFDVRTQLFIRILKYAGSIGAFR